MNSAIELPTLPTGHTVGCGDLNGQKVLTKLEAVEYATAAVLADRRRLLALAKARASHEASAARYSAMRDLIETLFVQQTTKVSTDCT